jgi:hypothetical protein
MRPFLVRDPSVARDIAVMPATARSGECGCQDLTTNASIATYGWLGIESTLIVSV